MSFPAIYPRNRHQRGTVIMDNNVENTTHLVANISSVWYLAAMTAAVLAAGFRKVRHRHQSPETLLTDPASNEDQKRNDKEPDQGIITGIFGNQIF